MKLKALAVDLDGTLLGKNHTVSEANKTALASLSKKGIEIIICTGRMKDCALPIIKRLEIDCAIVVFNGALAEGKESTNRECYHSSKINASGVKRILEFAAERKRSTNFYMEDRIVTIAENGCQKILVEGYKEMTGANMKIVDSYYPLINGLSAHKLAVLVPVEKIEETFEEAMKIFGKEFHIIKGEFFVEFLVNGNDKAKALSKILDAYNLTSEEVVAFGDGYNDKEFLEYAGIGISMNNGHEECKKAANKVSKWKNTEDAVAKELEFLISSESFEFK